MKRFWKRPVEIASHDIVTTAVRQWRTEDFQGMSWSEPLEWLTRDLEDLAGLSDEARPKVRQWLMDLLVDRAVGGKTGVPEPDPNDLPPEPRTVVLAGADPVAIGRVAAHWGASVRNDPLMREFCGLEWELEFHLPSMAEWQAQDRLDEQYESAARLSARRSHNATVGTVAVHVWCAFGHAEHLTQVRQVLPKAVIVFLTGGDDGAAGREAVRRRGAWSNTVDPTRVERYWDWRISILREKAEAQLIGFRAAQDPCLVEIAADAAVADPARLGAEVGDLFRS